MKQVMWKLILSISIDYRRISSLAPIAPPSQKKRQQQQQQQQQQQTQMATEVVTVIKTPHCKQCGHPVKGHKLPHH